jgi:phosphohistidine phosphatase
MARWASKHGVRPELVVCSNATRAQQTLEGVLPGLGEPTVWVEVTLYAAAAETLLARVRTLPEEVDAAMLVGHNPGLMELLLLLAAPGPLRTEARENLPTGALAELQIDVGRWVDVSPGDAELTEFVRPRKL